jgi:pimeloyl-ACP methyl ester carboxylesterase
MSYVDAGDLNTYYEVRGAGDPLVMLHGGFATIETWEAQAAALAERYQIFLPERRGHGRTPDVEGPLTYENMASDTAAFIEALAIGPAHLIGWSDGASVALYVALRRPELVRKVICMGAAAWFDGLTPKAQAEAQNLALDSFPPSLIEAHRTLSPDGPDHLPIFFEKIKALWASEPNMTAGELRQITAPTLVMLGDDDVLTVEHAATMAATLPDAQLAVVPGTDHGLMFEKPDLVNRLFMDFLADEQPPKIMS